ncbi:hypothetical protein DES52_117102 [Deinococcus yavapaiensis KR-236]|uniref:Uncharacterized protein n=1 Tax=Deinococcus yavapaiensis KR-236 TaxID=694435 RepID=A0A318S279_9DEIO|nr:hypothetical protein DES52_117102 [Deinococcus yavapaiensis KR-236]
MSAPQRAQSWNSYADRYAGSTPNSSPPTPPKRDYVVGVSRQTAREWVR